ncbi:MAG TPA: ABC transporter permease [Pyrinomonadaceae bacterium]|nr:ABC transporter permease [Pyrinomonadaceae bacterium]
MKSLIKDLRFAIRSLLKQPAFAVVAVVTLALGIGANTAVFSVINAVLLKSLPYKDPESLVLVWGDTPGEHNLEGRNQVSATDTADIRSQNKVFEEVATYAGWYPIMSGFDQPERIPAIQVGDGFFKVMKGVPMVGRVFTPEEQQDGEDSVIVLGYGLWQRRFGGDSDVVGKSVSLNGRPYTIVGVMGPEFRPLPTTLVSPEGQFYRPVAEAYDESERSSRHLRAIARLKAGVSVEQAQAETSIIAQRLEREHPLTNKGQGAHLTSITDDTLGNVGKALLMVFGAVILVLLVACANVANLLLARASTRHKELTIRSAIGAPRGRLIRQLLTESLLLAVCGGGLGLVCAAWITSTLQNVATKINPALSDIHLDMRTLAFTLVVTVVTALLFGMAPALQISNLNLVESLKQADRNAGASASHNRLRSALIVSEIALTLVLLVGAGLLIRTVMRLNEVDKGFNAQNVLAMTIGLPAIKYPKPENYVSFFQQVLKRIEALPGVKAAGITSVLPLSDNFDGRGLVVEDRPQPPGEEISVDLYVTSPSYLKALEIPLVKGRSISEYDTKHSDNVALINERMATQLWPNEEPLGKRIKFPGSEKNPQPWRTIVGVVSDVSQYALDKQAPMQIYLPHAQFPTSFNSIVIKTEGNSAALAAAVRDEVLAVDRDQAVFNVTTLDQLIARSIQLRTFFMGLLMAFAGLALILAAVGIYGVMSYAVTQRTREIGIRMALGAQGRDVLRLVVKGGMTLALIGVTIGMLAALVLTRLLTSLLFGITPTDGPTFVVVLSLVMIVALLACCIPAVRATRVDPLVALRYE